MLVPCTLVSMLWNLKDHTHGVDVQHDGLQPLHLPLTAGHMTQLQIKSNTTAMIKIAKKMQEYIFGLKFIDPVLMRWS